MLRGFARPRESPAAAERRPSFPRPGPSRRQWLKPHLVHRRAAPRDLSSIGDTGQLVAGSRDTDVPVETFALRHAIDANSPKRSPATSRNRAAQSRPRRPLRHAGRPNPERARSRTTSAIPLGFAGVLRSDLRSDARVGRGSAFIPRTFTRAAWIGLWQGYVATI